MGVRPSMQLPYLLVYEQTLAAWQRRAAAAQAAASVKHHIDEASGNAVKGEARGDFTSVQAVDPIGGPRARTRPLGARARASNQSIGRAAALRRGLTGLSSSAPRITGALGRGLSKSDRGQAFPHTERLQQRPRCDIAESQALCAFAPRGASGAPMARELFEHGRIQRW